MPYLPSPPTDAEKVAYTNPNGKWFGLFGLIGLSVFTYTSWAFYHKHPALYPYALFCLIYFANVGFSALGAWFALKFDYETHAIARDYYKDYCPTIDVYLPNCGEDLELLANQFKAVAKLDYPAYTAWVLDDQGRDQVRMLAELHGLKYLSRPNKGELKKAGNLRYAFARSEGEIIMVLDADFAPRPDMLTEAIFYFKLNPKLAILQTPQFFENTPEQPAIQRGATFLQEVFYRLIQNFRNSWGASVCCGSNAFYRRAALAPHGGAAAVERSEDVNTGMMVLRDGWQIQYLPLNLAKGMSPDTVRGFFNQQYRWCSGSEHLITSKLFWQHPNVSLWCKFSYFLSILYYSTSGLGIICFPLPSIVNVWIMPDNVSAGNYTLILPAIALALLARGVWAKTQWGLPVLVASIAASYSHLIALIDVVFGDVAPWVPTGASSAAKGSKFDRFVWSIAAVPAILLAILISGLAYNNVDWHQAALPLCWMTLQVLLSWALLIEIQREVPLCDERQLSEQIA